MQVSKIATLCAVLMLFSGLAVADPPLRQVQRAPFGDTQAVDRWLAGHPYAPARQLANAYGARCEMQARMGRYRAAADACGRMVELEGRNASPGARQSLGFWQALSDVPPIHVQGEVNAPLSYGWTGMAEAPVEVGRETASWGVDTGAEITTMSASDAARFGARMLDAPLEIHGSTPGTAAGHIGVIDHIRIGGARIDNIPVFVVPDAALTFDGRRVPPLLGAPVLYAFGRVEFANHGQRLHLSASQPGPLPGHLSWNESGVAIEISFARGRAEAHLDTGANISEMHTSTRSLLSSAQRSRLTLSTVRLAGVSGEIQRPRWRSQALDLNLGGGTCHVDGLDFGDERDGAQGRVGIDLVKSCENFQFDVSTMTFSARGD